MKKIEAYIWIYDGGDEKLISGPFYTDWRRKPGQNIFVIYFYYVNSVIYLSII